MRIKNKDKKNILRKKTTALVFDRSLRGNSNAAAMVFGRSLIACAITYLAIGYLYLIWDMPVNGAVISLVALGFTAVFSLIFAFTRRFASIAVMTIAGGGLILLCFDEFWERFSYFVDAVMLECDGRILDSQKYLIHPIEMLQNNGVPTDAFVDGAIFGSVILCAFFALITAAGAVGEPYIVPSFAFFALLWAPALISEKLSFNWRIIPIMALYAGVMAISAYYKDGMAIRHVYMAGGYRRKMYAEHRRFDKSVKHFGAGEKAKARGFYYSKYFSSVMSAAAMFAVLGIVSSVVLADSKGIDYTWFYDKMQNFGGGFDIAGSPFKNGAESRYFASPESSQFGSNNRLQLSSPSRSNKEILRVTKPITSKPLYLRGDIGIDFDGTAWNSPVTDEPSDWASSGLKAVWRPELSFGFDDDYDVYGNTEKVDCGVEYLCSTDVIFSPAYDVSSTVYNRPNTSVFGDFAARRKSGEAKGDLMSFTAFVPSYTDASDDEDLAAFKNAVVSDIWRYYENAAVNMKYSDYVNKHYLSVPENMKQRLGEFAEQSGLRREIDLSLQDPPDYFGNDNAEIIYERFYTAAAVSNFLKFNYTYSLNARINSRDPVMSFLNDAKSGHCALYASSMTLLLRNMGVPARYCTGFAASAGSSFQTLLSKDLHAWCEVYLNELGWVTFDPTASSALGEQGGTSDTSSNSGNSGSSGVQSGVNSESVGTSSNMQSSETHESVLNSRSSAVGNNSDNSDVSSIGGGSEFTNVLPYIMTILSIAAAAALTALIIIEYNNLKKRAYKRIQAFRREPNFEIVYAKMLGVMQLCKLSPGKGEQPHDFFSRAEEVLKCDICGNYELLQKLAFGGAELDAEERAQFVRVFETIYKSAEKKLFFIGKIRLRLIVLKKR